MIEQQGLRDSGADVQPLTGDSSPHTRGERLTGDRFDQTFASLQNKADSEQQRAYVVQAVRWSVALVLQLGPSCHDRGVWVRAQDVCIVRKEAIERDQRRHSAMAARSALCGIRRII